MYYLHVYQTVPKIFCDHKNNFSSFYLLKCLCFKEYNKLIYYIDNDLNDYNKTMNIKTQFSKIKIEKNNNWFYSLFNV